MRHAGTRRRRAGLAGKTGYVVERKLCNQAVQMPENKENKVEKCANRNAENGTKKEKKIKLTPPEEMGAGDVSSPIAPGDPAG